MGRRGGGGGFKAGRALGAIGKTPVKVKASVKQIDKGLQRIQNTLRSIQTDKSHVKAGYLGKAAKPRKRAKGEKGPALTNVQLGVTHEFGEGNIPARPHIRPAFARNRAMYLTLLKRLVAASVYNGAIPYPKALAIIGSKMAADMKKYVTTGTQIPPPNAGYPDSGYFKEKVDRGYWKRRGKRGVEGPIPAPRTLVDTGRMVGSITWAVVLRSKGDAMRGDNQLSFQDHNTRAFRERVTTDAGKWSRGSTRIISGRGLR